MGFNLDDPNSAAPTLDGFDKWLKKGKACNEGIKWASKNKERFDKLYSDKKSKHGYFYNMDTSIEVLKELLDENNYQYVEWYLLRVMEHAELIEFVRYAVEQLPIDNSSTGVVSNTSNARSCLAALRGGKEKAAVAGKGYEYELKAIASVNGAFVNIMRKKILTYGIEILCRRKLQ